MPLPCSINEFIEKSRGDLPLQKWLIKLVIPSCPNIFTQILEGILVAILLLVILYTWCRYVGMYNMCRSAGLGICSIFRRFKPQCSKCDTSSLSSGYCCSSSYPSCYRSGRSQSLDRVKSRNKTNAKRPVTPDIGTIGYTTRGGVGNSPNKIRNFVTTTTKSVPNPSAYNKGPSSSKSAKSISPWYKPTANNYECSTDPCSACCTCCVCGNKPSPDSETASKGWFGMKAAASTYPIASPSKKYGTSPNSPTASRDMFPMWRDNNATGDQGVVGNQGVSGNQGVTAIRSVAGNQGVTAIRSVAGNQGVTAIQSVAGNQGDSGNHHVCPMMDNPTVTLKFDQSCLTFCTNTKKFVFHGEGCFSGEIPSAKASGMQQCAIL